MVHLVTADLRLLDAALAGDDALAEALGHAVVPGWVTFPGALSHALDAAAADSRAPEWGTRFFVAGDPPELVGWAGFSHDAVTEEDGQRVWRWRRERS